MTWRIWSPVGSTSSSNASFETSFSSDAAPALRDEGKRRHRSDRRDHPRLPTLHGPRAATAAAKSGHWAERRISAQIAPYRHQSGHIRAALSGTAKHESALLRRESLYPAELSGPVCRLRRWHAGAEGPCGHSGWPARSASPLRSWRCWSADLPDHALRRLVSLWRPRRRPHLGRLIAAKSGGRRFRGGFLRSGRRDRRAGQVPREPE